MIFRIISTLQLDVLVFILLFFMFRSGFMLFSSPSTKQILDHCSPDQKGSGSGIMQTSRYFAYTIWIAILCIVFEVVVFHAGVVNDGTAIVNLLTPAIERIGLLSLFYTGIIPATIALVISICTRNKRITSEEDETLQYQIGGNNDTIY